jgi:hypothetical protein
MAARTAVSTFRRAADGWPRSVCSLRGEDEEGIVLDLLFASSGIEPEIVMASEVLEILPGLELPVARTSHLIALKVLSRDDVRRPTDLAEEDPTPQK